MSNVLSFPSTLSGQRPSLDSKVMTFEEALESGRAFRERLADLPREDQLVALSRRMTLLADVFPEAHAFVYGESAYAAVG